MINLKIEMLIDEDKVVADGRFTPTELYELIRNSYRRYGLTEITTDIANRIVFGDAGRDTDLGTLLTVTLDLYQLDWFSKYVTKCLFHNLYENTIDDFIAEVDEYYEEYHNKPTGARKKKSVKKKKKKYEFDFKVEILIDEEKVIADNKYDPAVMYEYIRNMFRHFNLLEVETEAPNHIIFTDKGGNKDMGGLSSAAVDLYHMDWFKKYALKLLWHSRNRNGSVSVSSIFDELDGFEVKGI